MALTERKQILVVEDDALVSDVITAALDDAHPVIVVETAAAALDVLRRGDTRLMLLDCTLPGGVDPALLPAADQAGTPVILMSGDPSRVAQLTKTPRPFIRKPFTLAGLLDTVGSVLKATAGTPGLTGTP